MNKKTIFCIASLAAVSLSSLTVILSAVAEPLPWKSNQSTRRIFNTQTSAVRIGFVPPAGEGSPRHTRGAASRTGCDALQILPESISGLTTEARPLIPVYFSETVSEVLLAIEAEDGSEFYEYESGKTIALPTEGGITTVPLPETLSELTLNKQYTWSIILICGDEEIGPSTPVIRGDIKRVDPVLTPAENETTPLTEKEKLYGQAGLWYDLISTMALMRETNPGNPQIAQRWESLLRSVGLDDVFEDNA
ncbi:MAG: DUF928 domain-containing protein [Cyanobacteria bacterium J06623_5]